MSDHESVLRALLDQVQTFLDVHCQSKLSVHSVQTIIAVGDSLNSESAFLSREADLFRNCVVQFTDFKEETYTFGRSLASIDHPSSYRWTRIKEATAPSHNTVYQADEFGGDWLFRPDPRFQNQDQEAAIGEWLDVVGKFITDACASFWVTQPVVKAVLSEKVIASAFVIFQGDASSLKSASHPILSKLLRDHLVQRVVDDQYRRRHDHAANILPSFEMAFSDYANKTGLSEDVESRIALIHKTFKDAINVPILFVGEAGTGKNTAVSSFVARESEWVRLKFNQQVVFRRLPAAHLSQNPELLYTEIDNSDSQKPLCLVIDDVHVASEQLQYVLTDLVDPLAPRLLNSVEPREPRRRARFLFTSLPGLDSLAQMGSFNDGLYSIISTVEVRIPPLRDRFRDKVYARAFVRTAAGRVASALGLPHLILDDDEVERLIAHEWRSNLRDLNKVLANLALARAQSKRDWTGVSAK